jgi:carbon-monoxide dehydrogenase small subunit
MLVKLKVNGRSYQRETQDQRSLLHFLRDELGRTGTKEGCGAGECGACTVVMNGRLVNSCMILAAEADGAVIETIEGEGGPGGLSEIQRAFERHHAVQCGFCTPGMIMTVRELLARNPKPSVQEIKEGIEGNFCRCTGYRQIIEAVLDVSGQLKEKGELRHV